ncbi:MAG: CBS domain-containing protein, partial [Plesiomonas sp.]
ARGFTADDFALSHPGGALGRKLLLKVKDIMHTGDDLPFIAPTASLRDTVLEISRKKLGMVVICDDMMHIQGIFTDGDLRRVFDLHHDLNNIAIESVMTRGGLRIDPESLAVEALNMMQKRCVSCLLVTQNDVLVGVIHMHDLLKAGVV